LREFIADLSQWYVRRSRERFKNEKEKKFAAATLRYVLGELSKLLAPFAPFAAEAVYQRTKAADEPESVHLTDWPVPQGTDERLVAAMVEVRRLVSLGLEERLRLGIKVRQPLASVKFRAGTQQLPADLVALIRDELNVREVIFLPALETAVELDAEITPELKAEGEFRELVRQLQDWRKRKGLAPGQLAPISVPRSKEPLVKKFAPRLKQLVAASEFVFTDA
jgi:isoleucyl-tRNA synthetase